jgi:IS30 family transposase
MFADWNELAPGFMEADLVAHCGDRVDGAYLNTLVLTDIATGWTEGVALLRRSEADVSGAIQATRQCLPFPLLGLDTDNGGEFSNHELLRYCEKEKITFARSQPYRKNDQAHVEEKNGSVIRRLVGTTATRVWKHGGH